MPSKCHLGKCTEVLSDNCTYSIKVKVLTVQAKWPLSVLHYLISYYLISISKHVSSILMLWLVPVELILFYVLLYYITVHCIIYLYHRFASY